jgi:hypothetical protein
MLRWSHCALAYALWAPARRFAALGAAAEDETCGEQRAAEGGCDFATSAFFGRMMWSGNSSRFSQLSDCDSPESDGAQGNRGDGFQTSPCRPRLLLLAIQGTGLKFMQFYESLWR